jgi:hypothetical protein
LVTFFIKEKSNQVKRAPNFQSTATKPLYTPRGVSPDIFVEKHATHTSGALALTSQFLETWKKNNMKKPPNIPITTTLPRSVIPAMAGISSP